MHAPEPAGELLVALDSATASDRMVTIGRRLARALDLTLTVLYVETPGRAGEEEPADVLALAARMGATVAKAPADDLLAGARGYATLSPVRHVVLPQPRSRRGTKLLRIGEGRKDPPADIDVTLVAAEAQQHGSKSALAAPSSRSAEPLSYALAIAATLATVPVLLLLRSLFGAQALGFLFVFPVLAIAARFGLKPALLSALLSTICYDLLVLKPGGRFGAIAPQDLVVASALVMVAVYASAITARMRERVALSDRSAQENASLAAFGVNLAREADWTGTGALVCAEVSRMFGVRSAVFRESGGQLTLVAAAPADAAFSPVDRTALQLAWEQGAEAGSGTATAAAADWQFQPLRTSLGTLAVLAVARDDGRAPITESKRLLFSTLTAQAALAHERLRLEDLLRHG